MRFKNSEITITYREREGGITEKGKKGGREKRRERTKETRKSTVNEILPRHRKTRPKTDRRHAIPPPPLPATRGQGGEAPEDKQTRAFGRMTKTNWEKVV